MYMMGAPFNTSLMGLMTRWLFLPMKGLPKQIGFLPTCVCADVVSGILACWSKRFCPCWRSCVILRKSCIVVGVTSKRESALQWLCLISWCSGMAYRFTMMALCLYQSLNSVSKLAPLVIILMFSDKFKSKWIYSFFSWHNQKSYDTLSRIRRVSRLFPMFFISELNLKGDSTMSQKRLATIIVLGIIAHFFIRHLSKIDLCSYGNLGG